jgi:hypothetical protein
MKDWAKETREQIDKKLEGEKDKELRFYRIDEFKRNIDRVEDFSKSCPFCFSQKIEISEISDKIDEAVKVPGKSRREYDRLISRLSKHMQKEHGFYAPYYFSYVYSFWGIVAGLLVGFLFSRLFPELWIEMLSFGFVAGILPGYIIGTVKDKKIRSAKKLM